MYMRTPFSKEELLAVYDVEVLDGTIRRKNSKQLLGGLNKDGYISCTITLKGISHANMPIHRLIWLAATGAWPAHILDHRDRDKTNNDFLNLREASHSQNLHNSPELHMNNRTGFKGVRFHSKSGLYQARIRVMSERRSLGYYETPEEAEAVYIKTKQALSGLPLAPTH